MLLRPFCVYVVWFFSLVLDCSVYDLFKATCFSLLLALCFLLLHIGIEMGWTGHFCLGTYLAVLSLLYSPTLKPSVRSTLYIPLLSEFIKAPKLHIIWAFKTWVKLSHWWFGRCVKKWRCSRAQRTSFKQQVPSPYNPLKLIPKSFLVSPVLFFFRWTLNFISWTLLERLQGNNKRSVLTSSNRGLIMLVQFSSHFKKECNKICFFSIELNNIKIEWKVDCWQIE